MPLAKLRNHSIDEVRGRRQPIEIPRDVADMYADLTAERERVTASMWELLVAYVRRPPSPIRHWLEAALAFHTSHPAAASGEGAS